MNRKETDKNKGYTKVIEPAGKRILPIVFTVEFNEHMTENEEEILLEGVSIVIMKRDPTIRAMEG